MLPKERAIKDSKGSIDITSKYTDGKVFTQTRRLTMPKMVGKLAVNFSVKDGASTGKDHLINDLLNTVVLAAEKYLLDGCKDGLKMQSGFGDSMITLEIKLDVTRESENTKEDEPDLYPETANKAADHTLLPES